MTYETRDNSVHDSVPIECYKFVGTLGTYRYTDSPKEEEVNGETYSPLPIARTTFEVGTVISSATTMDFIVPFDSDLAKAYSGSSTPDQLTVEVRRIHRGDNTLSEWRLVWTGLAIGFELADRHFTIGTQSKVQTELQTGLCSVYYQTLCNHVLYDERCKVNKASRTTNSTVVTVGEEAVTVVNDGVADGALIGGEIVNTRTGERRLVLNNVANVINLAYGFLDIVVGDTVTMSEGCDHAFETCINKFANVDNFGGFMFVPTTNPFEV